MASPCMCRLRRFLRFSCLVVFAAIGLSASFRSLSAELEYYFAKRVTQNGEQALYHLNRAAILWPYDFQMRTASAYFWQHVASYEHRKEAIAGITEALASNPYAADLWVALASYKAADQDEAGLDEAMKHVLALRPGVTYTKEKVNGGQ